jgi:hypothetical protein
MTREEDLRDFLLPGETLLFWSEKATLESKHGANSLVPGRVPTYEAGMYTGKDIHVLRQGRSTGGQSLSGTLMLTDKRILLVQPLGMLIAGGKQIYCEVIYDADLAMNLIQMSTARNAEVIKKYHEGGNLKRTVMIYKMIYSKSSRPSGTAIQVLSGAREEKRDVIIETSVLLLFLGTKQDLVSQPIKKVIREEYALVIEHPWSSGEAITITATALTAGPLLALIPAMALSFRKRPEQYNPVLDIVKAKASAMATLVTDMSMPLPPPP